MFAGNAWLDDRIGLASVYLMWIIDSRSVIVTEPVYSSERLIFLLWNKRMFLIPRCTNEFIRTNFAQNSSYSIFLNPDSLHSEDGKTVYA
jgi:hypothetical protein